MIKPGFIALGIAAGFLLLFTILSYTGMGSFGPCGPDTIVGMVLFSGGMLCGGAGLVFLSLGGLFMLLDRVRGQAKFPRN